jgi:hypothetical protein
MGRYNTRETIRESSSAINLVFSKVSGEFNNKILQLMIPLEKMNYQSEIAEVTSMARAKYQVLVFPYQKMHGKILYCVFKRSDMDAWQFIAGGGEDEDYSILESAKREAFEEAVIARNEKYIILDTQ